jgi:hypothetical protein
MHCAAHASVWSGWQLRTSQLIRTFTLIAVAEFRVIMSFAPCSMSFAPKRKATTVPVDGTVSFAAVDERPARVARDRD